MIRCFLIETFLFFLLLLVSAGSYVYAEIPDIVSEQKKAVVTVYVNDKNGKHIASGGGFIIDQSGIVVTNCQVVVKWFEEVQNKLVAVTEDGIFLPIENLISPSCENNLALFKVRSKELPAVKLAADYKPKTGESIFVIRNLQGTETAFSDGIIKDVRKRDKLIQISVPVALENSGSPVFNNKGEAVGAAASLSGKNKNINFAVPLKDISKQLNKYKKLEEKLAKMVAPSIPKPSVERNTKIRKEAEKKRDDADEYFLQGCSYHELGMYEDAIKLYRKSLKIKPDFAEAYVNLGVAYYKLGNYTGSIDAYKHAIRIKPDLPSVYNKLGAVYIIQGVYPKALDSFKKAIDVDPDNAVAHYNLGFAYFLNGEKAAAFKQYIILKDLDRERAKSLADLIY
ncbi:MAG: hypothetical protein A2Y97_05945 [Nitrospirae bacterium RBG_13_39_12]|nr:MAG: hypothetical protein A2Y97_05945 [Nitrospirae bacterium RBG_13_39_12]